MSEPTQTSEQQAARLRERAQSNLLVATARYEAAAKALLAKEAAYLEARKVVDAYQAEAWEARLLLMRLQDAQKLAQTYGAPLPGGGMPDRSVPSVDAVEAKAKEQVAAFMVVDSAREDAPATCDHHRTQACTAGDPYTQCQDCGAYKMESDGVWRNT